MKVRLVLAAVALSVATGHAARATSPCVFPWERTPSLSAVQIVAPHAALLSASVPSPLRIATVDERASNDAVCAVSSMCTIAYPPLDVGRVYLFRSPDGVLLGTLRSTGSAGVLTIGPRNAGAIVRERMLLGAEATLARRDEVADPAGVELFAVAPGTSLQPGAIYVWDQPSQPPAVVVVGLADTKEPPPLPALAPLLLEGHGACPAHGGVALVPPVEDTSVAYRWSILDEKGSRIDAIPRRAGPRPEVYALETDTHEPRLGSSYVLEVEAIDASGRVSPKARFPVALERTGGPGFGWEALLVFLWLLGKGAPVLGVAVAGTGAVFLFLRLRRRRDAAS